MYKSLDDSQYTYLRRELLQNRGSAIQREFLESVKDDAQFLDWIRKRVSVSGSKDVPIIQIGRTTQLTEHEYKDPPEDTEKVLYESWNALTPSIACQATLWGEITLQHIQAGYIKASYLAGHGSSRFGLYCIDQALKTDEQAIDACVRSVLRRLSGIPERGNRSVYVNCPFSRAWWRVHLCREVCEQIKHADEKKVIRLLRSTQQYWEELVVLVVSRNSVLGDKKLRNTLVWILSEIKPDHSLLHANKLRALCRILGIRAAWQEFGVLEIEEIEKLVKTEMQTLSRK